MTSITPSPSNEIPLFKVFMSPNVSESLTPILNSGMITQGKQVELFETKLKDIFKFENILTLNSATSGLTLAIRLLNLSTDDEILSCPLTCTATNFPILANNNKIKWVDVDPNTCNMDLDDLKRKITEKTKAVIVVFWGGYPVDLDKLKDVQKYTLEKFGHRLHVIEDCAHAFGSKYKDEFIGTHGNISVFSLQAIKHLTTGDGGLIFLPTKELYDRAKLLRWYGIDRNKRSGGNDFRLEQDIPEWGYKYHMNDISATIGIENLNYVFDNISKIRENASIYKSKLQSINGVELLKEDDIIESSYWLFTIKIIDKYGFVDFMKNKKIMVSQVHNRNDGHSCVKDFKTTLPNLDLLEKQIVSIPVGWWMTRENIDYVIECIKEWCGLYTIRSIKEGDYKGFLDLMFQLNNYKEDISLEKFSTIQ